MHPILFVLGPITVYSFGLTVAIAVMVCAYLMARDAERLKISRDLVYDFVFWTALAGLLGARIFYILLFPENFGSPVEFLFINNGGLAWQGGLILGIVTAIWFLKKKGVSVLSFFDLASPYVALGQGIGRIGCFLNGCCHGRPVEWGPYVPLYHAHLHPSQLYESAGLVVVFLLLKRKAGGPHLPGEITTNYLMLAAALRGVVQFFRYDYDPIFAGLGIYQWICVGLFAAGVVVLRNLKKVNPK